jgi:FkbM family methyltransferase
MRESSFDETLAWLKEQLTLGNERLQVRQSVISAGLQRDTIAIAGFGSKGQSMAEFLRDGCGKEVIVLDELDSARRRAESLGYRITTLDARDLSGNCAIILGGCQSQLEQAALFPKNYVFFEEAAYFFNKPYHFNKTRDYSKWLQQNTDELCRLFLRLPLPERKSLYDNLMYRVTLNPVHLGACRRPVKGMWFDVLEQFGRRKYQTMLDAGAFDGDTLIAAHQRLGCHAAIAVEANPAFAPKILSLKSIYKTLELLPVAAWSHRCLLEFKLDQIGMASVEESASGSLQAAALDDYSLSDIDIVKMDIEGSELRALSGANRVLSTHPDLALAVYHRPEDLVQIPALIDEKYSEAGFQIFIRHYSDCLDDTIIYYVRGY